MPAAPPPRPYVVRNSKIHGRGVFATRTIRKGTRIIEYRGERTSWEVALERPPSDPDNPHHTFFFETSDGKVIDANVRGNAARWINHSCDANCESCEDDDGRVLEAFTPDFYLPDQDLYVEITAMKQSLVTRKNRKLRKLRERYPDVRIKLFYRRDLERLAQHFHLDLAS